MKFKKVLIVLLMFLFLIFLFKVNAEAVEAVVSTSSAEEGGQLVVTVNFPSDVYAYEARIRVIFANGTEKLSEKYVAVNDSSVSGNFSRQINYVVTADVQGVGTAKVEDIILSDQNHNKLNSNSTIQTGFTVSAKGNNNDKDKNKDKNNTTNTDTKNETTNEVKNEVIEVKMKNEEKKKMYVDVSSCNVRNADSKKAEIIAGLRQGDEVKITGVTTNGWYRIDYYGEVAYVSASVLSDKKPEIVNNVVNNTVENETKNETENNTVTNEVENNLLPENELDKLQNKIGVIPEVGNNIADKLFVILTLVSLGYVFYLGYKNREV